MSSVDTSKKHWTSYTVPGIWSLPEHQKITHALRVGNTIYISGQTARGLNGEAEGGSDVEAQGMAIWRQHRDCAGRGRGHVGWRGKGLPVCGG